MRHFPLKAAIAAIIVSTSVASGYAASTAQNSGPIDELQAEAYQNHGDATAPTDPLATGAITKQAPAKAVHTAYRPRLSHIVSQLSAANERIRVDHNRGYLTKAEARMFRGQASDIHRSAMRVADAHRGAIPKARYASLQMRVSKLDREIHRAATT